MTFQGTAQLIFYAVVLTGLAYPLGIYMARVYEGKLGLVNGRLAVGERWFLRLVGSDPEHEQNWKQYAGSTLVFTIVFTVLLYLLLRSQGHLPLNPDNLPGVSAPLALNTAASFVTNTNWQYYGGEYTMSYLSQMAGLAVQNFVSAAVGMAVLAAVIRGFARRTTSGIGNFWRDLYRSLVYILLPLAVILGIVLISQGVPQTFDGHATATTLQGGHQAIARGPVASQIAIKQLGTNGGGWYNSNSAVPFENPNGFTNFLEDIAILLIPMAQVFMFGRMIGRMRQGWAIWGAMFVLMVAGVAIAYPAEQHGSQVLRDSGVNITAGSQQSGGNMQDKEVRFGIADTALWASTTTNASNGSVNGGHDALTPIGGAVPLVNIFFGEVIWGGVGSGLYGMFFYVLIAVFVAGLMVGRTPEYLGKKIEAREIKIAAVGALFVPIDGARARRRSRSSPTPAWHRCSTAAPTASPRRSTPTRRSRTTTAAPSPATARFRSRRTSAPWPCTWAGSCRCSPRSRSAGRWPPRRRIPSRPARSAPTARRSRCCSSQSSSSPPGS